MKHFLNTAFQKGNDAFLRFVVATQCALWPVMAKAQDTGYEQFKPPDHADDKAAGNLSHLATRVIKGVVETAEMVQTVGILLGIVVVCHSIYGLYASSKNEGRGQEKHTGAIIGLFVGGALISVPTIVIIMANTLTKSAPSP